MATKKKPAKKTKEYKEVDYEETEKFIMKRFEVSKRELFELKKFYPQKYESWLKELDSQIKSINKE
jgi:hypothetical protein